jgi:hypothetical protein
MVIQPINFIRPRNTKQLLNALENQFTHHELCDENHERQVKALLEAVDNKYPEKIRPCDL